MPSLPVLLNAAPLNAPLSGIGRYMIELSAELLKYSDLDLYGLTPSGVQPLKKLIEQVPDILAGNLSRSFTKIPLAYHARSLSYRLASSNFQRSLDRPLIFHDVVGLQAIRAEASLVTIHDLSVLKCPEYHPPERVRWIKRFLSQDLDKFDRIITVSNSVKDSLINDLGISPSRILVTPLGSHLHKLTTPSQRQDVLNKYCLDKKSYFLIAGNIEPRKNITGMLSAYEKLPDRLKKAFPLVIVGGVGWHAEPVMSRIASVRRVRYLGRVSDVDMAGLLSGARALLFVSHYEGFGLPALEANLLGTRVITSLGSPMETIIGDNGTSVNSDSPSDIFEAIISEIQSVNSVAVNTEMNWKTCAEKTYQCYQQLCGRGYVFNAEH